MALNIFVRLWRWTGFQSKTLWDWLQLLIVPVILASGATLLDLQADKRREDSGRQEALKSYIANMTDLLVNKGLAEQRSSAGEAEAARALTITVLEELDPHRKRSLVQFLSKAKLIE